MIIRYPGSKDKHLRFLRERIPAGPLCEPFAGTAAVSYDHAANGKANRLHLNDLDRDIAALHEAIRNTPDELIRMIAGYTPDPADFYAFRKESGGSTLQQAFRKIVLHQISYSGLGAKAGSPIGGRNQTGKYLVGCRWNAERLIEKIRAANKLLQQTQLTVTSRSWETLVDFNGFLYVDPPYYKAGPGLYREGNIDHAALAGILRSRDSWLVSYDDHPDIRALYGGWANIEPVPVTSHPHHKTITDLIITPRQI